MIESWRPVADFPGYEVSDAGRVRSYWVRDGKRRGRGVRLWRDEPQAVGGYVWPKGYLFARLYRENGTKKFRAIHTLVLEAFVGPRPGGAEACHGNGNPADNRLENLRWGSRSENQHDTVRHGRHRQAKLTEDDVRTIWERLVAGDTGSRIARDYGVGDAIISQIRTRKAWSHVTADLPGQPPTWPRRGEWQNRSILPNAKLTATQVITIRERMAAGDRPVDIAVDYGVGVNTVRYIRSGHTWSHI